MKPKLKKINVNDLSKDELVARLDAHGIKSYRAGQVLKWIYSHQADTFDIMSDLSKDVRNLLANYFTINRLEKISLETSQDGSKKYLFKLEDGNCIETVLIPEKNHYTLCISSQVGCAQGCTFCLTAKNGFIRNLTTSEIVAQIRDIQKDLGSSMPLSNIVFMGMGEPLANYKNVIHALKIITDSEFGLKFSSRKVTLSTAGLVPKLADLGRDTNINLAISLNATNNKIRSLLMPINKKYPIENLLDACRSYKLSPRRRITFEYILIRGMNDSTDDARCLAKLLRPIKAKINLIPFNEYKDCDYKRSDESVIRNFQDILMENNYTAVIRYSKGQDISAACGQLRAKASFIESSP
ncbi:MAG: 23S rRNA (adenine(2503)-C(2))-methyltransferase RlmN [Desulfobacterales bacterium]|nr:23S rRNA (adenine(2503)-C(2))-methyltransferase RlmN [Desulfobacterales bacterium]